MELDEELTAIARRLLPLACQHGINFHFDYCGPGVSVGAQGPPLIASTEQLIKALVDRAQPEGSAVFMYCQVRASRTGVYPCSIRLIEVLGKDPVAIGYRLDAGPIGGAAKSHWDRLPDHLADIEARCDEAGGLLRMRTGKDVGTVYEIDVVLKTMASAARPHATYARGLEAWLLGTPPLVHEALTKRLQRIGWGIRLFHTIKQAREFVALHGASVHGPAMVFGTEAFGIGLFDFNDWCQTLDPRCQAFYAATDERDVGDYQAQVDPRVHVQVVPFSPRELWEMAHRALERFSERSHVHAGAHMLSDRRRVLVVDDNELNRVVAVQMLWALGYEADTAVDGHEAVAYYANNVPSAIIMDLNMPGMDGLQATREIRRAEAVSGRSRVPIFASTASFGYASDAECKQAGMDAFLPKPLDLTKLHHQLRRWLPQARNQG